MSNPRTRGFATTVVALVLALVGSGVRAVPAASQPEPVVVVDGRGWGHGRGLGQHGALGYAVDHGWDWRRILGHFYGNTTEGRVGSGSEPAVPGTVGAAAANRGGFWLATAAGGVVARAGAPANFGSMAGRPLASPVLGLAAHPTGDGYWLVAGDGGVFNFGASRFHGSTGALALRRPVVGMAGTASGHGYWLVASDGGIFTFGDASFHGSTGAMTLARPVVGMAPHPSGRGYWLVASDGGIFAFGDAPFHGSTGGVRLSQPVVGMAPSASGNGYWLVAADGGVFTFGDAPYLGSVPELGIRARVVAITPTPSGQGYWLVTDDGRAHPFGDATVSITVRLMAQAGQDLIVWRPNGGLQTNVVGGRSPAWRVRPAGSGFHVDRGTTCAGPWTQVTPAPVTAAAVEISAVDPRDRSGDHRNLLGVCRPDGTRFYRGQLHAYREGGTIQTRNQVDLELYLRGVVPREMPASWGGLGGGRGIHALAAQAVAARSYAWAEDRSPAAKTCDTTTCQVYNGAFLIPPGGSLTSLEDARTDEAVRMTASVVRLLAGKAARTEFSSSTGGFSAGGTFPAVEDLGDRTSHNRVSNWTEEVKVSAIEAAWPSIGRFGRIDVLRRNGLGAWGGRVLSVRVTGSAGAVTVSGEDFRSKLAAPSHCTKAGTAHLPQCMKSNWFNVRGA